MPTDVNMETLEKHFKDAPNRAILPARQPGLEEISQGHIKTLTETFWANKGADLSNAYQLGRLLAKSKELKHTTDIFEILSDVIIQGVKSTNLKSDISSEKIQDSFLILSTIFKVIGHDLNALYAPGNSAKTSPTQSIQPVAQVEPTAPIKEFKVAEFLATLNGFITAKIYG